MQCRLMDLAISLNGKQRLTVELDGDFRQKWDELHDIDCDITVKKYRKKRSLDANAYCWVLLDKIAEKKRITRTEAYRNAIRDIGGVSDTVCVKTIAAPRLKRQWSEQGLGWQVEEFESSIPGWTNLILYYGSSVYDSKQFSDLLESVIQDAHSLGIETKSPEEIKSLMEEYERYAESHRFNGTAHERARDENNK